MRSATTTLCAIAAATAATLPAQSWAQLASTGPSARGHVALAYDSLRGRTVLFGGLAQTWLGDTWELEANGWRQRAIGGPPARHSHAMVYDQKRQCMVLFGGYGGTWLDDTWEYDGKSWRLWRGGGPQPREGHALAYDTVRNRVLLYGGWNGRVAFDDFWDFDGKAWHQRAERGPGPRVGHAMTYDAHRSRTVLFGGTDGVGFCGDTWEWDGRNWSGSDSAMRPRSHHAMAYDSDRQVVVLVGGGGGANETWEWNGTRWRRTATAPGYRIGHGLAYDAKLRAPVLFGGIEVTARRGDTWAYTPFACASAQTVGPGCGYPGLTLAQGEGSRPIVGRRVFVDVLGATESPTYIAIGFRDRVGPLTPWPQPNLPNCRQMRKLLALVEAVPQRGGAAALETAMPNLPNFLGLRLTLQSWSFAPGWGQEDAAVSNGVEWLVGAL